MGAMGAREHARPASETGLDASSHIPGHTPEPQIDFVAEPLATGRHGGADPRRDAGAAEFELGIYGGVSAAFARVMVEVHEVAARHDLQPGAAHAQRRVHLR